MRFEDLVGQERAITVLRNALRRDRIAHAYLFSGPESVGKSTAAVIFAKALNCEAPPESRPCGECRPCQLIAQSNHPDVRLITIGRDSQGKQRSEISIDQVRQNPKKPRETPPPLIHDAYLKPALGGFKVYLIDPADRMTAEASNALLKVLEEPPPQVVIVLVTAEASSLLPTVISRCQQVSFQLVGSMAIERHLVSLGISPETAASLARLSGGRIAWAISAAQRPEVLAARKALLDLCVDLQSRGVPASLKVAEEIKVQAAQLARKSPGEPARVRDDLDEDTSEEPAEAGAGPVFGSDRALRAELPWCLDVMVSWYRDLLAVGQGSPLMNPDYEQALQEQVTTAQPQQAECAVEEILETKHAIQRNANIDVALESLVIELVGSCD